MIRVSTIRTLSFRVLHPACAICRSASARYFPSMPFNARTQRPDIRFSSDFLRFFETKAFLPSAVRYAVVSVDKAGNAVLTGLADNNGVLLVKGAGVFPRNL